MTREQLARVEAMANQTCWQDDLSDDERASLKALLAERTALREALEITLPYVEATQLQSGFACVSSKQIEEQGRVADVARAALGETT